MFLLLKVLVMSPISNNILTQELEPKKLRLTSTHSLAGDFATLHILFNLALPYLFYPKI
jgi:hypothetical protein